MTLPPPELTDAQLFALARGREIRHGMRGPLQNGQVAARVFRDAIAAIEENGSATAYFRLVAEREPVAFMKFLLADRMNDRVAAPDPMRRTQTAAATTRQTDPQGLRMPDASCSPPVPVGNSLKSM